MTSINITLKQTVLRILSSVNKVVRKKYKPIDEPVYIINRTVGRFSIMDQSEKDHQLAIEIATALDDMDALLYHKSLVRQFPESVLREKLAFVLSKPKEEIYTTRARYFNHLMKQYAYKRRYDSRN